MVIAMTTLASGLPRARPFVSASWMAIQAYSIGGEVDRSAIADRKARNLVGTAIPGQEIILAGCRLD
jgi:hypothetical protein